MKRYFSLLIFLFPVFAFSQPYSTILHGKLSVNAQIDSTADRSGFQIFSFNRTETKIDTLGIGYTDVNGNFAVRITAQERGVYPVYIIRQNKILAESEMVIAREDSASTFIRLPIQTKKFFIRSEENAAWLGFTNTRAVYENELLTAIKSDSTTINDLKRITRFTADMLWNLDQSFPKNSVGVELAKAESIVKLMGWEDSLAVARAKSLPYDNPGFIEVARATRRGIARLEGQENAIQYLKMVQENVNSADKFAAIHTEIIQARMDSLQQAEAIAEVNAMLAAYPSGQWHEWAKLAEREVNLLFPGLFAPEFNLVYKGKNQVEENFQLTTHRGKVVVLEFWAPTSKGYIENAPQLEALTDSLKTKPLTWLSMSIDQSIDNNQAFLEGRKMPGIPVILPNADLLNLYNIRAVPMWVLIDKEGRIVKKYAGVQLGAMIEEMKKQIEKPYTAPPRVNAPRQNSQQRTPTQRPQRRSSTRTRTRG